MDVLESMVGLQHELERRLNEQAATPEEARRANAELRASDARAEQLLPASIEARGAEAARARRATRAARCPTTSVADIAAHLGFSLHYVSDLPHSTRSVTDLKNRRIYLTQAHAAEHDPRSVLLQALGHYVLGHQTPHDYADFLRQRVDTNYFAAALLMPSRPPWTSCRRPRRPRTWPSRTSAMPSPCPTRPPRTGSPTWPPSTWASRATSRRSTSPASSTRPTRTTA